MAVLRNILALMLVGSTLAMHPANVERLKPQGLRFTIKDEGYRLVAVHFNVNTPLHGVGGGQYNFDINTKTGNDWIFEKRDINVNTGDTINYWIYSINKVTNEGHTLTDLTYTVQDPTTTAVPTRPPTTQPPRTQAPITQAPQTLAAQTQAPLVTSGGKVLSQTGSGSGTSASIISNVNSGSGTSSGASGVTGSSQTASGGTATGTQQQVVCKSGSAVQCTSYPCLVFEDNFDFINFDVWEHEITASGGGNWEFQYYTNNRSNSYTHDGVLYIKPTLTSDKFGEQFLTSGTLELYGNSPADACTGPQFWGCSRQGTGANIINPIQSARLRSTKGFSFKYGRVEVEAKMPKGDWLWPAIWLLPKHNAYGQWPASGEIDIVEARGNLHYTDDKGGPQGVNHMGSTLHFGPAYGFDPYEKAHAERTVSGNLADSWHKYGLEWDENSIKFFLDGSEILNVRPDSGGFWKLGELDKTHMENPYRYASKMAPFDQEFYFILNVAVGGTAFFPDKFRNSPTPKPWRDDSQHASSEFYAQKNIWYPTWNPDQNDGEDAAMKINYIKVWKLKP